MASTFRIAEWSIVPGPATIRPPFDSTKLIDVVDVTPEHAADSALSIREMVLETGGIPEWWCWSSFWRYRGNQIALSMTIFETSPPTWGGFSLSGTGTAADLLRLYRQVHELIPTGWLHHELCELHTAESFSRQYLSAA